MLSSSVRILTNHWGQGRSETWRSATTYFPPEGDDLFSSLKLAIYLYTKRTQFDCVVLGGGHSDIVFALLQSVLPFKNVPCIMIDCYWGKSPKKYRFIMRKAALKIINKGVDKFAVWAIRDIEAFSNTFSLPKEKFVFVPYHTTLVEYHNIIPYDGGYIFSGGNACRDYDTLIEAVRGLPIKLFIASTDPGISPSIRIPENVDVRGYSTEEYLWKMAGCSINVVALASSSLRSGGQQTFLNSMWLGKPTIVTDIEGALGYIKHGKDGILIRPNDPVALREAIQALLDHPNMIREIALNAAQKAKSFSTDEHFKKIVSIAEEVVESRRY